MAKFSLTGPLIFLKRRFSIFLGSFPLLNPRLLRRTSCTFSNYNVSNIVLAPTCRLIFPWLGLSRRLLHNHTVSSVPLSTPSLSLKKTFSPHNYQIKYLHLMQIPSRVHLHLHLAQQSSHDVMPSTILVAHRKISRHANVNMPFWQAHLWHFRIPL